MIDCALYLFLGETTRLNLFQSLTSAMDIALERDPTAGKDSINKDFLVFSKQ